MRFLPLWLAQIIGDSEFEATVDRIARFIEEPVWSRVSAAGLTMNSFELRGYVRARSALLVQQHVVAEAGQQGSEKKYFLRLSQAVGDAVIQRTMARIACLNADQQQPVRIAA